jgi:sugar phosphate permease
MLSKSNSWWQPEYSVLALIWLVYGCFYLNRLNLAPVIPLILKEFNFSHTQVGLITSFFFAFYSISEIFLGYLSDIYGPRKIITFGGVVSAIANFFFSAGAGIFHFIGAQSLNGFGQGGGWGPSVKLLNNWFPKRKIGRVLGIYATSMSFFTVLTFALAAFFGNTYSWRAVFRIFPTILILVMFVYWLYVRDQPGAIALGVFQSRSTNNADKLFANRNKFIIVLANHTIRLAAVAFGCLVYTSYTILIWVPTYLYETYSLSVVQAGLLTSLYPALGLLARPLGGYLSDVTFSGRRKPLLLIGFIMILLATASLAVVVHLQLAMTLILCVGFFDQLIITLFFALLIDILPPEFTGTGASLINAVGHVACVAAMFFSGLLVDAFHSYRPVFLALTALAGVAIISIGRIRESENYVSVPR